MGTTNGLIFSNNQFSNRTFWGKLDRLLTLDLYAFSFIYNTYWYRQTHPQQVQQTSVVLTSHAFSRKLKYKYW